MDVYLLALDRWSIGQQMSVEREKEDLHRDRNFVQVFGFCGHTTLRASPISRAVRTVRFSLDTDNRPERSHAYDARGERGEVLTHRQT